MASQPMAMQAFYPHAMGAIASPAGTPSGMVATPAFFGNPALSGTSTAGGTPAGATYTAVWPGGQVNSEQRKRCRRCWLRVSVP